jgi:hypothetical protein
VGQFFDPFFCGILLDKRLVIAYNFKWYILFTDFFKPWESLKEEVVKGKRYLL